MRKTSKAKIPHIEITQEGIISKISVDGKELHGVRKITFDHIGGQMPTLEISMIATDVTVNTALVPALPKFYEPFYERKPVINGREERISEIMDKENVDHDIAESLFLDEISEKYDTDDMAVAEVLFELDWEDGTYE